MASNSSIKGLFDEYRRLSVELFDSNFGEIFGCFQAVMHFDEIGDLADILKLKHLQTLQKTLAEPGSEAYANAIQSFKGSYQPVLEMFDSLFQAPLDQIKQILSIPYLIFLQRRGFDISAEFQSLEKSMSATLEMPKQEGAIRLLAENGPYGLRIFASQIPALSLDSMALGSLGSYLWFLCVYSCCMGKAHADSYGISQHH